MRKTQTYCQTKNKRLREKEMHHHQTWQWQDEPFQIRLRGTTLKNKSRKVVAQSKLSNKSICISRHLRRSASSMMMLTLRGAINRHLLSYDLQSIMKLSWKRRYSLVKKHRNEEKLAIVSEAPLMKVGAWQRPIRLLA